MKLPSIDGTVARRVIIRNPHPYFRECVLKDLTFENPAYKNAVQFSRSGYTNIPEEECMAFEADDDLWLPRGYTGENLPPFWRERYKATPWKYRMNEAPVAFPERLAQPHAEQRTILDAFEKVLKKNKRPFGTYLAMAGTGVGKTFAGALMAERLGQRTLILCRTNLIRDAWYGDLYKLYGMSKQDIGLIQQAECRVGDHFTLATIATLSRRKAQWGNLFKTFGTVIVDEVHIIGAESVREITSNCAARHVIGLTATKKRGDKKDYVLDTEFGDEICNVRSTGATATSLPIADARIVYTSFTVPVKNTEDTELFEVLQYLATDAARNKLIVDNVEADYKAGHSVLVASASLNHLDELNRLLMKRGLEFPLLTGETNTNRFYTAKLVEGVLNKTIRGVLASTQAVKLGANLNPLDRLHLALPPGNETDMEQLAGRIRRQSPGKKDAKIVYYHDANCWHLRGRLGRVFIPTMRKLGVPRFNNMFIC